MDCSWAEETLASDSWLAKNLSPEQLAVLSSASNEQFLTALADYALEQRFSRHMLAVYEPLFPEVCTRWRGFSLDNEIPSKVFHAFASILPQAPYLTCFATEYLFDNRIRALSPEKYELNLFGKDQSVPLLMKEGSRRIQSVLLSIYRLLIFDIEAFRGLVSIPQLLKSTEWMGKIENFLAIKILKLLLEASDYNEAALQRAWLEDEALLGHWEDRTIDYRFLTMWEDNLYRIDGERIRAARLTRQAHLGTGGRHISSTDLSKGVVEIAGRLLPHLSERILNTRDGAGDIVPTQNTLKNLGAIADGLLDSRPLLLFGAPGCGKTSLILEVASLLNKKTDMVTLHLNAQTDAKLLVGLYISDVENGSFKWQPGVLSTAVTEGRWVLIEDLDRAPVEVLSVLLPLIETNTLTIPSTGTVIRATEGFRLIATVRGFYDRAGNVKDSTLSILGIRLWNKIVLSELYEQEIREIIDVRYPRLARLVPDIWRTYQSVLEVYRTPEVAATSSSISMRDLMKWCSRTDSLARAAGSTRGNEALPDIFFDHMYQEAIDCFAASLPSEVMRSRTVHSIAVSLQVSPETQTFYETQHLPRYDSDSKTLRIGRVSLRKATGVSSTSLLGRDKISKPFANTRHALQLLESVGIAVKEAEPILLVGETGTGKTTAVQRLAESLGRKLTVVNLSQQSEAGDLLGGYKPVNIRILAMPLKQEFDDLFGLSFSAKRNQKFSEAVAKYSAKQQWPKVVKLWREAVKMVVDGALVALGGGDGKRRKLDPGVIDGLRARWMKFAEDTENFALHLGNSSQKFAFSFVEGSIVKAVRNGDWVLLDEINLAAPDTLEALADLFQSSKNSKPSLLLSEKGDIQQVAAHHDFRVFAAMNPATDVGKKDLPAGIRSRFTEIFVESPDKSLDALIPVVTAYLGSHCVHDSSIAHDISQLYLEAKRLSESNQLVDGANQKPHFSLRTLTRTLSYVVDITPMFGLRRAVYEGFCMSFLTLLDRQSERLLIPLLEKNIFSSPERAKSLLRQTPKRPSDSERYVEFKHYWIKQGEQELKTQADYIITPFVEKNLLNLVRAVSTRKFPILIQGPTSSGKTSMIEYLAKASGNKFMRINNHEHTDLQEYLGSYVSGQDGQLHFEDGVLVRALREGHWIVLDELNLAPTDVLEALNRLLDDNRELLVPETQEIVRPHPNFVLFATQNPPGLYGGRKFLSRAFRNRFLELHFDDIPEAELETILRERTRIAPSFCSRIVAVYRELSILRQSSRLFEQKNSFATLRDLFRWALRDADDREHLAQDGFMLLAERVRDDEERQAVKAVIERVMKTKINEDQLYDLKATNIDTRASSAQKIVMTKAMKRLCTLVQKAIKHNEPVLLIGETGCGKTSVCQILATACGKQLFIVNAHQNMETGDLIGAQRPIRNRAALELQLRDTLLSGLTSDNPDARSLDLQALIDTYKALENPTSAFPENILREIETSIGRYNSLFEWTDGSLVQAMRSGDHFLLDEISLADDSVLERLNSVLESHRTLLLAEKGSSDAEVTAQDGFQFLATMNPGGDYGKRELSPALRNRFTEIWVPALSDQDDLAAIVNGRLAESSRMLTSSVVDFAVWYTDRYSLSKSPTVSVRDLVTWVDFINLYPNTKLGFFHGACLVYIDPIGANPAAMVAILPEKVSQERHACFSKLEQLTETEYQFKTPSLAITKDIFKVGQFSISRQGHTDLSSMSFSFDAETTCWNTMRIVRALQLRKPILIEGNPGVGKTTLVTALASITGNPLVRINLSEQTDLMDLFGSDVPDEGSSVGSFVWRDAPFLTAMQNGHWVLLDEMNLASQSVLEGLNACLDHRGEIYVSELDMTFRRHPDFVLFAAQNPHHQGGGRKGLPASFVNRFTVVYADEYSENDMHVILNRYFPGVQTSIVDKMLEFVRDLHNEVIVKKSWGHHGSPWEFNLRDVLRWMMLITSTKGLCGGLNPAEYFENLFGHRFRSQSDVERCIELCQRHFGAQNSLRYYQLGESFVQIGKAILSRKSDFSGVLVNSEYDPRIHLPQMESVAICIQHSWPCILVGSSGSGKSEILKQISAATGNNIVLFSMNSDMDATDLVGGYEQSDLSRTIETAFSDIKSALRKHIVQSLPVELSRALRYHELYTLTPSTKAARALADAVELMPDEPALQSIFAPVTRLLNNLDAAKTLRFEWVDGILVQAIQKGDWLVLDNANLCSSSVLDRLNSLMEPNGTLVLNEKRTASGTAAVITPHRDFRLFLCMDPRYGELSRAMRNRAIEIFVPNQNLQTLNSHCRKLHITSNLGVNTFSRAADALRWQGNKLNAEFAEALIRSLPANHFPLLSAWTKQLASGLLPIPLSVRQGFNNSYETVSSLDQEQFTTCLDLGLSAFSLHETPKGFSGSQPIYSLFNGPLAARLASQSTLQSFIINPARPILTSDFSNGQLRFDEQGFAGISATEYSLCDFLCRVKSFVKENGSSKSPFTVFVKNIASVLCTEPQLILAPEEVDILDLMCLQTLRLSSKQRPSDPSLLTMLYLTWENLLSHNEALRLRFAPLLAPLERHYGLRDGVSMSIVWKAFRPQSPRSATEYANQLSFVILLRTIDQIAQTFEYPLDELVSLRARLMDLNKFSEFFDQSTSSLLSACRQTIDQIADNIFQDCLKRELLKSCRPISRLLRLDEDKKLLPRVGFSTKRPYFCKEFDYMNQYFDLLGEDSLDIKSQTLIDRNNIFGRKATEASVRAAFRGNQSHVLEKIKSFTRSERDGLQDLATLQGQLPSCLLVKLAKIGQANLDQLDVLELELDHLVKMLANFADSWTRDVVGITSTVLQELIHAIIAEHLDLSTVKSIDAFIALARQGFRLKVDKDMTSRPNHAPGTNNSTIVRWLDYQDSDIQKMVGSTRGYDARAGIHRPGKSSRRKMITSSENTPDAPGQSPFDLDTERLASSLRYPEQLWIVENSVSLEFSEIMHSSLIPALDELKTVKEDTLTRLSHACVLIADALGDLYFPDRPFDPARNVDFNIGVLNEMENTLQRRLSAATDLQSFYFGNHFNLSCKRLEASLLKLNFAKASYTAKSGDPIYRTRESSESLVELFSHSSKLLKYDHNQPFFGSSSKETLEDIKVANQNIASLCSRYKEMSCDFGDLTEPAIGILTVLQLGLSIRALDIRRKQDLKEASTDLVLEEIPLMGMQPPWTTKDALSVNATISSYSRSKSTLHFPRLALLKKLDRSEETTALIANTAFSMFSRSHASWKALREKVEREHEESSGLYRFKDPELLNDEEAEGSMFPLYDEDSVNSPVPAEGELPGSKETLIQLTREAAHAQSVLFGHLDITVTQFLDLAVDKLPLSDLNSKSFFGGHTFVGKMLPALILKADQARHKISAPDGSINFYHGSNLKESRNLVKLVREIRRRFEELSIDFPENASIQDVIECCRETLAFRVSDPLAKIITKAEKLHSFVHLWQSVASSKYSAAVLKTNLTELLVSWRRIELSTWGQLFDEERKRCMEVARNWWFNVFETVFLFAADATREEDILSILKTLNDFMISSTLGGFKSRLELLKIMLVHRQALDSINRGGSQIVSSIRVLVAYYSRFIATINGYIENGTRPLEKKMKDIILLASWKDTNIAALRDSAKRSHNKLYRVVRKFRDLLEQPVEPLLRNYKPSENSILNGVHTVNLISHRDESPLSVEDFAILENIKPRSPRFRNLSDTVQKMKRVGALPEVEFDISAAISSFVSSVDLGMQELRKATPQKWSKEDSDTIKRLKVQKRKLFSDTLKTFKEMGFSANPPMSILAKQHNQPSIFLNSAAMPESDLQNEIDDHFFAIVNLIPRVMDGAREHTDDLSGSDVARSVGYIQSSFNALIRQRSNLAMSTTNITGLQRVITTIRNVSGLSIPYAEIHEDSSYASNTFTLVKWLPMLLQTAAKIVGIQCSHAQLHADGAQEILMNWSAVFQRLGNDVDKLLVLPAWLANPQERELRKECEVNLAKLRDQLSLYGKQDGRLEYIISQLHIWAQPSTKQQTAQERSDDVFIKQVDQEMQSVCDLVFVALQSLAQLDKPRPESIKSTSWLVNEENALTARLQILHASQITNTLHELLGEKHSSEAFIRVSPALRAVFRLVVPVLEEYVSIFSETLNSLASIHLETTKMVHFMCKNFVKIAAEGFCTPKDTPKDTESNTEKLEAGTGLGDGEGNEDISKDVQDDEDMEELAQQPDELDKDDLQKEEDAVDIPDEMEGGADAEDQQKGSDEEGEESEAGSDEEDIDEDVGSVDELDPDVVDEKMWDGKPEEDEKELEGKDQKGANKKDEPAAAQENNEKNQDEEDDEQVGALDDTELDKEGDIQPHVDEGRNLDLPEEMDLDGSDEKGSDSEDGLDDLSDIDDGKGDEEDAMDTSSEQNEANEEQDVAESEADHQDLDNEDEEARAGDEVESDDEPGMDEELKERKDNAATDADATQSEVAGGGQDQVQAKAENAQKNMSEQDAGVQGEGVSAEAEQSQQEAEGEQSSGAPEAEPSTSESAYTKNLEAMRSLGNAMEKFLQNRKIQAPPVVEKSDDATENKSMEQQTASDFEHLPSADAQHDAQALDSATADQAGEVDESMAIDTETRDVPDDFQPDQASEVVNDMEVEQEELRQDQHTDDTGSKQAGAFIGDKINFEDTVPLVEDIDTDDVLDVDNHLSTINLSREARIFKSREEASVLWQQCEARTRPLSLALTEQLRLILAPTLSAKMRGDFRTGKRLNMKRIIPYIASQYKRDKIWMRRSMPSKRNYQVLLAVDDSKSMNDRHISDLAFDTLTLVSTSLSMLEVGNIGIIGFGEDTSVVHDLDAPFSGEAGIRVLQQFSFQQTRTNVQTLVKNAIDLFSDSKLKSSNSGNSTWQLLIIISDGVCEDHPSILRLYRQAYEEKIMIVFIIVDCTPTTTTATGVQKSHSILDLTEARFEVDPGDEEGRKKVRMIRYLDSFPFAYYLVVRNITELPSVLSTALRGWFAEVAEAT